MNPSKSLLRERWAAKPMRDAGKQVLERLERGLSITGIPLPQVGGLLDLRGFRVPPPTVLGEISGPTERLSERYQVQRIKGRQTFRGISLVNANLTFAELNGVFWENCTFERVEFRDADLRGVRFASCNFRDVNFDASNLGDSYHGTILDSMQGTYDRVTFRGSTLVGSLYSSPLLRRCDFSNAKLNGVDFRGSRFEECKFGGRLTRVWFHGRFADASPGERDALRRAGIDPDSIVNPMRDVDFSGAVLDDCMFVDGVDLGRCRFPQDGAHIVLRDRQQVFSRLEQVILETWQDPERSEALKLLRLLSSRKDKAGQRSDVINKVSFGAGKENGHGKDQPWLERFLDMMQQLD